MMGGWDTGRCPHDRRKKVSFGPEQKHTGSLSMATTTTTTSPTRGHLSPHPPSTAATAAAGRTYVHTSALLVCLLLLFIRKHSLPSRCATSTTSTTSTSRTRRNTVRTTPVDGVVHTATRRIGTTNRTEPFASPHHIYENIYYASISSLVVQRNQTTRARAVSTYMSRSRSCCTNTATQSPLSIPNLQDRYRYSQYANNRRQTIPQEQVVRLVLTSHQTCCRWKNNNDRDRSATNGLGREYCPIQ